MPQSRFSVDAQSLNIAWPTCPTCETPRILIVEDEMLIADLIDDIVREIGYAVSGKAHNLLSARQELGKRNFDAVLLDIGLDGQHNPELADWLLEMDIPFAFVTGYDHPFEARHDKVPLLQKPFTGSPRPSSTSRAGVFRRAISARCGWATWPVT